MRIHRSGGRSGGEHLERDDLRPLVELKATVDGEQLVVDFRNPLPVALADVVIRVHYEGCRGKPGTFSRQRVVGRLDPGAGTRAQMPRLGTFRSDTGNPPDHRAHSVQLEATGTDVTFDLDAPLAVLGVQVGCPDR